MEFEDEIYVTLKLQPPIIKLLGAGQFGMVYLVKGKDGVEYALKVQSVDTFFNREWEVPQIVNGKSPYLVQLYDKVIKHNSIFIKMELANNVVLTKILNAVQPHPCSGFKPGTLGLMWQMMSGVHVLHTNHIIHRHLITDNIMLHKEKDDRLIVKIIDYGLSRPLQSVAQTQCGSPLNMAPEIMNCGSSENVSYNEKADIWACGLLFYQMVSHGKHPFQHAQNLMGLIGLLNKPILRPPSLTIGKANTGKGYITDPLALNACWELIQRMLSFDSKNRPSAEEVMQDKLFSKWRS